MRFTVIIPARFASTRLPGKPLLDIGGKPMIQRVYEQACSSEASEVVIATDDSRIREACEQFSAKVIMTRGDHASGTDRLQEAASILTLADDALVVNVQGDEPLMPAELINQVAGNLHSRSQIEVATLCEPLDSLDDFQNPNIVKVVSDSDGSALYFSRAPIPWPRDAFINAPGQWPEAHIAQRHLGIYAYRVALLNRFVAWPQSRLERAECLEQLRVLENGAGIHVDTACTTLPAGIDTEEDLQRVRDQFAPAS